MISVYYNVKVAYFNLINYIIKMLHVVITDESVWTWKGHSKVSTFEKVPIHLGSPYLA